MTAQETVYVLRDKESGWYFRDHEWESSLTMAQVFRRKTTAEYAKRRYLSRKHEIVEIKITYEEVSE